MFCKVRRVLKNIISTHVIIYIFYKANKKKKMMENVVVVKDSF